MPDTINHLLHRLVLEALPFGICVVNTSGKVTLWSQGAEKLTGYLRQDVVGRPCDGDVLKHCDVENSPLEGASMPLIATLREGRTAAGQLSVRIKGGQYLPVKIHTIPLRDDRGTLVGAAELFEPIPAQVPEDRRQAKLVAYGCLDTLTGVLNHSMIQAHLKECLNLHLVYPIPFCAMRIAIDELPELRKRYGQAAVDAALRAFARTIENGLGRTDFLGRWVCDEFLAILTECNEHDAQNAGERLVRIVRNCGIPWWGDKIHVTVSIGAAVAQDNDTVGSIVSRAEQALHECAQAGGNRVVVIPT